jgi:hypothetical protein
MTPTIHFAGVFGGDDLRLLPRLIDHYSFLGVTGRWFIGAQMASPADPQLERAREIVRGCDIDAAVVPVIGPWRHRVNTGLIQRMRQLYPHDWTVVADQDEFHFYPDSLTSIVGYCEQQGYEAVRGELIDRVAADGSFPPIESGRSLWLTFPLGGDLSHVLIGDPSPQIVIAKGSALLSWGSHYVARGVPCPAKEIQALVHHFKWDATVIDRLKARIDLYTNLGEPWADESASIVNYIISHKRIDITDPQWRIRYLGNPYGEENMLAG